MAKTKRLLILGNGFDLDLGLKTKFSDFATSDSWEFLYDDAPLIKFLNDNAKKDQWFDIETLLKLYAQRVDANGYVDIRDFNGDLVNRMYPTDDDSEIDEKGFYELVSKMTAFIKEQEDIVNILPETCAALLFKAIVNVNSFEPIYTFNYTDLNKLAEKLDIQTKVDFVSVHGNIKSGPILGIEDTADVRHGYSFLYKTFDANYSSNNLKYDLDEAKLVIFFGHSLGNADYHYFETFFKNQCDPNMPETDKVHIIFFTYDDKSRRKILEQLRDMNKNRTDYLFSLNELEIICTSKEEDRLKLERLLKEIQNDTNIIGLPISVL